MIVVTVGQGTGPLLASSADPYWLAWGGIGMLVLFGLILIFRKHRVSPQNDQSLGEQRDISDREQIRRLVHENGGRMHQSEIVESVDWSKAKVSRLLSDLEEENEISKLRLGRENLVCLPEHEPSASRATDTLS